MEVRACEESDLPLLDQALPVAGPYGHAHRLRGQEQERWLYLVAFDPAPVGACLVHWRGPVHDDVRRQLPDAVEITHLYVAPEVRDRGVGHALVAAAEREAQLRVRRTIGVGVSDDNPDARRLYERLGYTPTGARYRVDYDYVTEAGATVHAEEQGDFLTKTL